METAILGRLRNSLYGSTAIAPGLGLWFNTNLYFKDGVQKSFDALLTSTASTNGTLVNSSGTVVWRAHNLALNSAAPATQGITVISGARYTVECTGTGSVVLSGAGTGTVTAGSPVSVTASTTTLTLTVSGTVATMWAYRSDLGGMAPNPDTGTSYVPTAGSAVYMRRANHHVYENGAWVNAGCLTETWAARTNLLLNSLTLSTQSATVTAVPHTLSFTGTGTVTLSGVSTAGPLVGTGTGENNRVTLTFTPTAGSLTLTVSGTVTNAQLEAGSTPSSYIPTLGTTATRGADGALTVAGADMPWPTTTYIGSERVTNGDFATDLTGWTTINTASANSVAGEAVITNTPGSNGSLEQSLTLTSGNVYELAFNYVAGVGTKLAYVRNSGIDLITSGTLVAGTQYKLAFKAGATNTIKFMTYGGVGNGFTIDNVSVREINPLAVSIAIKGRMTYADEGAAGQVVFARWRADVSNRITLDMDTDGAATGEINFEQAASDTVDTVVSSTTAYAPGIDVPFNIASRHGTTFINGAVGGTALTADLTPVALPALSATSFQIGNAFMGTIESVRVWSDDIGNTGIASAST